MLAFSSTGGWFDFGSRTGNFDSLLFVIGYRIMHFLEAQVQEVPAPEHLYISEIRSASKATNSVD